MNDFDEFCEIVGTRTTEKIERIAVIHFVAFLTTRDKTIKVGKNETVYDIMEAYDEWEKTRSQSS